MKVQELIQSYFHYMESELRPDTVRIYKSALKRLLLPIQSCESEDLTKELLMEIFNQHRADYSASRHSQVSTAWNGFCKFAKLKFGVKFANGKQLNSLNSVVAVEPTLITDDLLRAIRLLFKLIPTRELPPTLFLQLSWNSLTVETVDGVKNIGIPGKGGIMLLPPGEGQEAIKTLYQFAKGDNELAVGPLVPTRRGGKVGVSYKKLKDAIDSLVLSEKVVERGGADFRGDSSVSDGSGSRESEIRLAALREALT